MHAAAIVLAWQTVADEQPELDIAPAVLQAVMLAPSVEPITQPAAVTPPPVKPQTPAKPTAKPVPAKPVKQPPRQTQVKQTVPAKPAVTAPSKVTAAATPAVNTPTPSTTAKPSPSAAQPATPTVQLPLSDAAGLNNKPPMYPKMSRKLKEQGRVILLLLVKADGTVAEVRIQRSSGFNRLDQAALNAVKRWTFIPAKQQGQAIDYWYEMPLNFTLNP